MNSMQKIKAPKIQILRRPGRPTTLPGPWGLLAKDLKGVDKLATAVGLSVRQTRRIAHRECPLSPSTRIVVLALMEKHGKLETFQEWLHAGETVQAACAE
jgi:hypothetical protein